jgi:hypothetical protein
MREFFSCLAPTGDAASTAPALNARHRNNGRGEKKMIHHLSIAAQNPQRVGEVFAELIDGVPA